MMNVLSLFDGMSCGQIALNRLGIKYDKYFASEIDKYAIGIVDTKNGPFLAFMNPEQGFKALNILLDNYNNHSIKDMISKYAPAFENNTDLYINNVCKKLNCKSTTLVKKVNRDLLIQIIAEIEGYKR
jgi:hypothetical protein